MRFQTASGLEEEKRGTLLGGHLAMHRFAECLVHGCERNPKPQYVRCAQDVPKQWIHTILLYPTPSTVANENKKE